MLKTASLKTVFRNLSLIKLSQGFLALFILFFPFQIRTLVYSGSFYLTGNFNEFTSFFVYINDLFLVLALFFWGLAYFHQNVIKKNHEDSAKISLQFGDHYLTFLLLLFLGALSIETIWIENRMLHFMLLFRLLEFVAFYFLIVQKLIPWKKMIVIFLISVGFQAFLAILQYFVQGSLGLRILGEPIANSSTLGIAKIDVGGGKVLRAFGTFPHANVLGGALMMALIFVWLFKKWPLVLKSLFLSLFMIALLLCFSRSALFGLFAAFMIYFSVSNKKFPYKLILLIISLIAFFVVLFHLESVFFQRFLFGDLNSDQERTLYLGIGKLMLIDKPFGVGLGGFTLNMQNYSPEKIAPWIFQPVHNVFLLVANEGGLITFALFLAVLAYVFYRLVAVIKHCTDHQKVQAYIYIALLVSISTVSLFDHYFFSLYPGLFLLFFYLGLTSEFLSNFRLPSRKS